MERKRDGAVERTQKFFGDYYDFQVSELEARRINDRIVRFFRMLKLWHDREAASKLNSPGQDRRVSNA